jgi:hypothetical protein
MLTGKAMAFSAALAATSPANVHELLEAARSRRSDPADVEAGLAVWRQWAADAGMALEELAPVLARMVGCSAATVRKVLTGA